MPASRWRWARSRPPTRGGSPTTSRPTSSRSSGCPRSRLAGDQPSSHDGRAGRRRSPARSFRSADPQAEVIARDPRPRQRLGARRRSHQAGRGWRSGSRCRPTALEAIEQRLKQSGQFETVEVRKRYRSLDRLDRRRDVLLVHERPGRSPSERISRAPAAVRLGAHRPADVPADPRLRRRLRLQLRRPGQHARTCSAPASSSRCR